jgi:hypothetical protein
MMKKIIWIGLIMTVAANLQAAVYYSQGTRYLTSGANWNTESDGSGSSGFSATYRHPDNDIVMQQPVDFFFFNASAAPYDPFNANSYLVEDGVVFKNRDTGATSYATFNGGDITVASGGTMTIQNSTTVGAGNSAGGFNGSASLNLASGTTLVLDQSSSQSSGDFEFGLNVVGGGAIDLDYANDACNWYLSALSSDFTGVIRGDTFNGSLRLAAGDGAINADLIISRSNLDKTCTLDMDSSFSVDTLKIDGETVTAGIYTYAELVAFGDTFGGGVDFSDNLIDNGGTVYIGQVIPEPATLGMITAFGGSILFIRRRFMM